jgi:hypothetical protein
VIGYKTESRASAEGSVAQCSPRAALRGDAGVSEIASVYLAGYIYIPFRVEGKAPISER